MVSWTMDPTVEEIEAGVEGKGECIVSVHVQPELKLPNQTDKGDYEWAQSNALHPFWFIKRAENNDEPNAETPGCDPCLCVLLLTIESITQGSHRA